VGEEENLFVFSVALECKAALCGIRIALLINVP
jgi:hypothetical protein